MANSVVRSKHLDRDHTADPTDTTSDDQEYVYSRGTATGAGQNTGGTPKRSKNAAFTHIISALRSAKQRNPTPKQID